MGFETPLALLGLGLAALPIAIHLLRRRDLRRRTLPTVALLRRAERRAARRVRLVDLLLLLARMALLAALVIAAAGPTCTAERRFGTDGPGALAIVLDDSASMGRRLPGGGTAWSAALREARQALAALPPGSQSALILAGAPARVAVGLEDGTGAVERALAGLDDDLSSGRGDGIARAIDLARGELARAELPSQELLLLSDPDGGRTPGGGDLAGAAQDRGPGEHRADPRLRRLRLVPPEAPVANAAIAEAFPRPGRAGDAGAVEVLVRRFPEEPETDRDGFDALGVRLEVDGALVAEGAVDWNGGIGRASLPLDGATVASGEVALARVALTFPGGSPGDALPEDDGRGLVLGRARLPRLLLVDGTGRVGSGETGVSPVAFFQRALDASGAALRYDLVDEATFAATRLDEVDAVVLVDPSLRDEAAFRRLVPFVEGGGGLLLFPGASPSTGAGARRLEALLGPILPSRLRSPAPVPAATGLAVAPPDPLALGARPGLERVVVRRVAGLEAPEPERGRTALLLTPLEGPDAGEPALVVGAPERGVGPVAVSALGLGLDSSDLVLRPGFVPLVIRLTEYLGVDRGKAPGAVHPGGAEVTVDLGRRGRAGVVVDPGGLRHALAGRRSSFTQTGRPGVYRVEDATGSLVPGAIFVVAPPLGESDLSPPLAAADPDAGDGANPGPAAGRTEQATVPVAPAWFLAAGLLLAIEAVLRRVGGGRRPAP
jgi:hypothetical protein